MTYNILETHTSEFKLEKFINKNRLPVEAVPFVGQAKQTETEPGKVLLRLNPLSSNDALVEFKTADILFAENIETVSRKDGTTFEIVKIWVRIGSVGIKLEPFSVQNFSKVFDHEFDA